MGALPEEAIKRLGGELRRHASLYGFDPLNGDAILRILDLARMIAYPDQHGPEIVRELIELDARDREQDAAFASRMGGYRTLPNSPTTIWHGPMASGYGSNMPTPMSMPDITAEEQEKLTDLLKNLGANLKPEYRR